MTVKDLCDELVAIGKEALDYNKPIGGCGYYDRLGKWHNVYEPKENDLDFHVKDPITGKFKPDPRVVRIGEIINKEGGLSLMQAAFYEVKYSHAGTIKALEYAWHGIGEWIGYIK